MNENERVFTKEEIKAMLDHDLELFAKYCHNLIDEFVDEKGWSSNRRVSSGFYSSPYACTSYNPSDPLMLQIRGFRLEVTRTGQPEMFLEQLKAEKAKK